MINFEESRFIRVADFKHAARRNNADFSRAEFRGKAESNDTELHNAISFNDVKFLDTTSFRNASFDKPPKFFNAELHKDTDFGLIDWKRAERSCRHSWWRGKPSVASKEISDDALRTWDELALIMSQRERFSDRHEFFRLKMRAQRFGARLGLTSILGCLQKNLGLRVGGKEAFCWWIAHMVLGAVLLAAPAVGCHPQVELGHWQIV